MAAYAKERVSDEKILSQVVFWRLHQLGASGHQSDIKA